ncbi:hypothetical protein U1Q18_029664 [Sarracenia purpurea var. burkii]
MSLHSNSTSTVSDDEFSDRANDLQRSSFSSIEKFPGTRSSPAKTGDWSGDLFDDEVDDDCRRYRKFPDSPIHPPKRSL